MKKTKNKIASDCVSDDCYSVIKFLEKDTTLFDCIPDVWFADENKDSCFWPPIKGKNVALRAIKRELPDESWKKYDCVVVKGGFVTYNCGRAFVREKCSQTYNTSSAEEHVSAARFRRQHPVLSLGVSASFEDVFAMKKSTQTVEISQEKSSAADEPLEDGAVPDLVSHNPIPTPTEQLSPRHNSSSVVSCRMPLSQLHHPETSRPKNNSNFDRRSQESTISSKRRRDRSPSCQYYSSDNASDYSQAMYGSKSSLKRKNVESSPENSQRSRSKSIYSPSLSHRSQSSRASRDRRDRSRYRRSNSSSSKSASHSRSVHSPPLSRSGQSYGTGRTNKTTNFDRRREDSERLSDSVLSKRRGRSRQSYSSNGRIFINKSKHASQAGYDSNNSQHRNSNDSQRPSAGVTGHHFLSTLMEEVRNLSITVCKNHHENDRRLTRMEVSINKILVRMGDISRSNADQLQDLSPEYHVENPRDAQAYGETSRGQRREIAQTYGGSSRGQRREHAQTYGDCSRGQRRDDVQISSGSSRRLREETMPPLPVSSLNELSEANQKLMNKEFFSYLVNREKEFCMPSKNTSNNVVMTTYLRRFITLRVRSLLTLKELQSDQGMTLFADFYNVYTFLIEVLREGYKSCNKFITEKEAKEALRIVWGRTKQLLNDAQKKTKIIPSSSLIFIVYLH